MPDVDRASKRNPIRWLGVQPGCRSAVPMRRGRGAARGRPQQPLGTGRMSDVAGKMQ